MVEGVLDHQDLLVKKASQVKMAFLGQQDRRENQVNPGLESQDLLDSQDILDKKVIKDHLAFQEILAFQVQKVNQAFRDSLVCQVPQVLLVLLVQLWKVLKETLGLKALLGDQVYQVQKVPVVPLEMQVLKERGEIQAHLGHLAYLVLKEIKDHLDSRGTLVNQVSME